MKHDLDEAIILDPAEGTISGEPPEDLQAAIDAGVLYVCPINDGTCPNGKHKGGPFVHLIPGKTFDDYDRLIWGEQ